MSFNHNEGAICAVHTTTHPRARKEHICSACGETIRRGICYALVRYVCDGSAGTDKRCPRCEALHAHLRGLCAEDGNDRIVDDRLDCGQSYEDEWGDVPPEIAALAFTAPGECVVLDTKPDA